MLLQLRDYILREKIVNTQQLTREFSVDYQALIPMLQWWIKKGVIMQCDQKLNCKSSCFKCKKDLEYYTICV